MIFSVLFRGEQLVINASRFDKPWPRKDTDETRKWIEMELEHNDIAERMMGSFFRVSSVLFRGEQPVINASKFARAEAHATD